METVRQTNEMNRLQIFFLLFFVFCTTVYCEHLRLQTTQNIIISNGTAVTCSGTNSTTVIYTENVLLCARKCKHNISCTGIVYNEKNLSCEVVINGNLSDCSPVVTGTKFGVTSRVAIQTGEWKRILSLSANGSVTFGNISSLKPALLSGKSLQVTFGNINNIIHSATINTVIITGKNLCAQSNDFLFTTKTPKILSFLICTNGIVQSIKRTIGTSKVQSAQYFISSTWFVRESDYLQVVVDSDDKSTDAIYNQLEATQAFILTIVQRNNALTKIQYTTYTNLLDSSKHATIMSHGEICMAVNGSTVVYADEKAWETTTYNFTSSINEERCSMSGNMQCETQVNTANQKAVIDWNWKEVFHHTTDGNAVFGSISSVRINLMKAQRLLIHCEGIIREPDIVIDGQTDIVAFYTSYPTKQNFSNNSEIVWEMLTTSGRYERLVFDASSGDIRIATNGTKECMWFVDKVTWTKVHDLKYNTNDELRAAVESGSRLRIKVNSLAETNSSFSTSYTCLYGSSVFQIYTDSKKIVAKSNLFPSVSFDYLGLHLSNETTPTWMNFNVVSFGNTSLLRRNVLTHEQSYFDSISQIYADTVMINDEWYAN